VIKTEGKKRVAILVPEKPIVHRDEIIRATIYRKAPGGGKKSPPEQEAPSAPEVVVRRSRTRVVVPKTSAQRTEPVRPPVVPEVPPGAQAVPCSCGATFIVRRKDLSQGLTCARCGVAASFEEIRDPQTLAPTIRVKGSLPG